MNNEIKQVVILSGGKGTRMREMTESLPKPMVPVGGIPVLEHLINIFQQHNEFEFLICSGYKSEIIENHFDSSKNVKVINTGLDTNTGGRLYNIREILDENFLVTYGDGLANVNITNLINFHNSSESIGTITVTNPTSRFGLVEFTDDKVVKKFIEKPKLDGFINIGFMVFNNTFLKYLTEDSTLESNPLMSLSEDRQLRAFVHSGYFEPMDTYREYLNLNKLWDSGEKPWTKID